MIIIIIEVLNSAKPLGIIFDELKWEWLCGLHSEKGCKTPLHAYTPHCDTKTLIAVSVFCM